jgi:hypothetical protein
MGSGCLLGIGEGGGEELAFDQDSFQYAPKEFSIAVNTALVKAAETITWGEPVNPAVNQVEDESNF